MDRPLTFSHSISDAASWEVATRPPPPSLATTVGGYAGFREVADTPTHRREVAGTGAVVIIGFGDPMHLVPAAPGASRSGRLRSFVAGASDGATRTEQAGDQRCVQVDLTATGTTALFGLPASDLTNSVVPLDMIWGERRVARLEDALADARSWSERLDLVDRDLVDAAARTRARPTDPGVLIAWDVLERHHGNVPIAVLHEATGYGRGRLAARFRDAVGLNPKTAAQVLRFRRALRLLTATGPSQRDLAAIAAGCGYHDQPHLNRDVLRFAGCSPTAYLAAQLIDVPGTAADSVA